APGADPLNQVTRLPPPTRLFLAGNTVSMVGNGLVIPYPLIYLHQVRGIVPARPDARSFKTVHIESHYGPGVIRDVFITVAAQMGKCPCGKRSRAGVRRPKRNS